MTYTPEVQKAHNITLGKVLRLWGKASNWQCVLCFDPARDWAFLWRTHEPTDPEGFVPMCRHDHAAYDQAQRDPTHPWRGKKRPEHSEVMKGNQNRKGIKFKPEQDHGGARIGNQNLLGHKHSDETRAKMRASRLAYLERKLQG